MLSDNGVCSNYMHFCCDILSDTMPNTLFSSLINHIKSPVNRVCLSHAVFLETTF